MQHTVGFIGAGNMTQALVNGLLTQQTFTLIVSNRSEEKLSQYNCATTTDNLRLTQQCDIVILAVKPHQVQAVCQQITPMVADSNKIIVSLAIGVSIKQLSDWLPVDTAIIRAMPNTPTSVRSGVTGLVAATLVTETQQQLVYNLFAHVGNSVWLTDEQQLTTIAAIAGSSPAYFLLFLNSLAQAAVDLGIAPTVAQQVVTTTMIGTGLLAQQLDYQFDRLRNNVTSKGGSTAAAVDSLQHHQFDQIIHQAVIAAIARSEQIQSENQ